MKKIANFSSIFKGYKKYLVVGGVFTIYMLFFDNASFLVHRNMNSELDKLTRQKQFLQKQFNDLFQIASHTDKSFLGAVRAQEAKQLKGLEHLEKRLLKAQKKKHKDQLDRAISLRISLFPKESLQERVNNFSEYMIETQGQLIKLLIRHLNPFDFRFVILCYEECFPKQGECIEYFK